MVLKHNIQCTPEIQLYPQFFKATQLHLLCHNHGYIEHIIEENRPWPLKTALAPSLMTIGETKGFKKLLIKISFFINVTWNKHNICNLAYIS